MIKPKKATILLTLFITCFSSAILVAQDGVMTFHDSPTPEMTYRIKQLNEFIDRFNLVITNMVNGTIDETDNSIYMLFDQEESQLKRPNQTTQKFVGTLSSLNDRAYLSVCSNSIYAKLASQVTYNNKANRLNLILKKNCESNTESYWNICGVTDSPFSIDNITEGVDNNFISPKANELAFSRLNDYFITDTYPENVFSEDYNYDQLSVFIYLLKTRQIQYDGANTITYYIFDIPGWVIELKYFDRNNLNSGWLVSSLTEWENKDAKIFFKN